MSDELWRSTLDEPADVMCRALDGAMFIISGLVFGHSASVMTIMTGGASRQHAQANRCPRCVWRNL